ncbi:MAG: 4Fe-4S binding protein [Candidatus Syntropharchaeia archaeon]
MITSGKFSPEPDIGQIKVTISFPKIGASGKTGTWRVFRPVKDEEKCTFCGLCYMYCPEAVIDKNMEIDYDYCKGCGICANECPSKAIEMVEENGS